jgi:dTDP-4-dehydrorhamnose 3,5-epimerase
MKVEKTTLNDCLLIRDTVYTDERGFFIETFNAERFRKDTGMALHFVQDNQSRSTQGVLRGLHFQMGDYAQAKLVRVLRGQVLDVAVDLRTQSSTYGQYYSVILSETSHTQLFIPRGFAHGFLVLSEVADFFYKCDNYYNKQAEGGIIYNDPQLNINWQLQPDELVVSDKDKSLPLFDTFKNIF